MENCNQGDIIKAEGIKDPVLVVSTNYYNKNNRVIVCPIVNSANESVINIKILSNDVAGIALCDQLRSLDVKIRGIKKVGSVDVQQRMLISDVIQGLFDYI